jgi:D-amino-acid oxidase
VLTHNVGLRPSRKGGPRVEVEWVIPSAVDPVLPPKTPEANKIVASGKKMPVVHAYGFR